ncbi:transcription factor bHLH90 [Quillaja saponaria]|uniref:Transcription factor bHLH90 n=1 Tax=Quillaja saponaria TaxID=32244 RepID=A0AAD7P669_QUISA|nr:transcription factor bHLH90 [Quillaja saponaria]
MRDLERAVEWLRTFVETQAWDYCVVWKLGDDPSRYIEWVGCCCRGGVNGDYKLAKVKEEKGEGHHLEPICKDTHFQHPLRTKACEALAQFPSAMPLYSGIHGEVVISKQPMWLSFASPSDSNTLHTSAGTQVLIPITGGLVELLQCKASTKRPKDHRLCESSLQCPFGRRSHVSVGLYQITQSSSYLSIELSSSGSNPSNEHPSFDSKFGYSTQPLKQSVNISAGSKRSKSNETFAGTIEEKDKSKVILGQKRELYVSKNLVTERNRRSRIKDRLFALRSLVPNISKMDRAAIIGDAIEYIGVLLNQVKELQDELRDLEEEETEKNKPELRISMSDKEQGGLKCSPPTDRNQNFHGCIKSNMEVQVEVNQTGTREFLIRLYFDKKQGRFAHLMDAIDSLGLQVHNGNMTTFDGKVLSNLLVEANKKDIQPEKLRDSLIMQIGGQQKE